MRKEGEKKNFFREAFSKIPLLFWKARFLKFEIEFLPNPIGFRLFKIFSLKDITKIWEVY